MIAALRSSLAIVVDFQETALNFLSVHLDKGIFGTLMSLKLDVGEALRLFRLPVVCNSNRLDFPKATEPITDIVLLEAVR